MERVEKENVKIRTLAISQLQEDEERQREISNIKTAFTGPSTANNKRMLTQFMNVHPLH